LIKRLLKSDLVKNSIWLFTDKGLKLILGLLVSVVVARFLGPNKMGEWNFAISYVSFFTVISFLGFDSILPREFVRNKAQSSQIISTTLIARTISSLIAMLIAVLGMGFWKGWGSPYVIYVFILSMGFLFQTADILDYYFQSILRSKYASISRAIVYILVSGYKLLMVYFEAPLVYFVASVTIELFLTGIGFIWFFRKKSGIKLRLKYYAGLIKDYGKDILPLAISGVLIIFYMRIDQVMITEMLGEKENGIYSIGVKILELVYFIPGILTGSYLPAITYVKIHEPEKYRAKLLQFYSVMTYLAIAFTLLIAVNSFWVMDLLYGREFEGSGMILFIYSFSIYSTFIGVATSQYLTIERLLKISLYRTFIGAIANILLNLWLIPRYGINGAAFASFISYFISTFALMFFRDTRNQIGLLFNAFNPNNIKQI
jgi:O-antigen/teichoic acid export membrane protein